MDDYDPTGLVGPTQRPGEPSILDYARALAGGGIYGGLKQAGVQTPGWMDTVASIAQNPDLNAAVGMAAPWTAKEMTLLKQGQQVPGRSASAMRNQIMRSGIGVTDPNSLDAFVASIKETYPPGWSKGVLDRMDAEKALAAKNQRIEEMSKLLNKGAQYLPDARKNMGSFNYGVRENE